MGDFPDAFGRALHAYALGRRDAATIIERDDGLLDVDPCAGYFAPAEDWPERQRKVMALARGRVLDIGCGAGRHALYLQARGHEVVGIDESPLAVALCRERGLRHSKVLRVTKVAAGMGRFDTLLMLGNNFGLFGNPRRGRWLLRRLSCLCGQGARLIAESLDLRKTDDPVHLAYHARNRQRGRPPGQVHIRVRYRQYVNPWFEYWLAAREEMVALTEGTGWVVNQVIADNGPAYVALMERTT